MAAKEVTLGTFLAAIGLFYFFIAGLAFYWQKSNVYLTDENVQQYVAQWQGRNVSLQWMSFTFLEIFVWFIWLKQHRKKQQGGLNTARRQNGVFA